MKPKQILLMNELLTKMVQEVNPDYSVICDGAFYCDVDDMTISYSRNSKSILEQMFADYIYKFLCTSSFSLYAIYTTRS